MKGKCPACGFIIEELHGNDISPVDTCYECKNVHKLVTFVDCYLAIKKGNGEKK